MKFNVLISELEKDNDNDNLIDESCFCQVSIGGRRGWSHCLTDGL